jgi:hypothetical protein
MPTYASTASFDLSIDEIAEEAYERCGLQVRSGYDLQTARRSLNLLLAEWANRGLNLWTIQLQEKTIAADTTSLTGTSLFGSGANDSQQIVDITDVVIRDSSNSDFSATSISRSTYFYILQLIQRILYVITLLFACLILVITPIMLKSLFVFFHVLQQV